MRKYLPAIVVVAVIAAVIIVVAVAGGNNKTNNTNPSPPPASSHENTNNSSSSDTSNVNSPSATDSVSIANFAFSPSHVTVKKGSTVTWTNNDSVTHTVSKDSTGGPDSKNLAPGDTYSFTFNDVGTFGYHCNLHQSMHGTVEVTQ